MRAVGIARSVSLVALTAILFSPGLWLGAPLDAAVFVLAGVRIRDGYVPYKDLWDHKPPGAYLLNAMGQTVLPWLDPWLVSWLLTVVFTGAAILIVDRLLRLRLSPIVSFVGSLLCLAGMAVYPVALGGGATESFAILPLVAALWAIASSLPTWPRSALIGCLLGLACLLSMQALAAAVVLFAVTVAGGGMVGAARRVCAAIVGGAALPLAVIGWLAARGALGDAIDQIVTYNSAYRASADLSLEMVVVTLLLFGGLAVPVAITVARMARRPRAFDRVDWACLAWSGAFVAYIVFQGRIYLHYWILLLPPISLLAGSGLGWLVGQLKSPNRRLKTRAIGLVTASAFAFSISAMMASQLIWTTTKRASDLKIPTDETAAWVKASTPASATVFVWGDDPVLYLASDRDPYDRYVYEFPLTTAGYWSTDRTAMLLAVWTASPPPVVVESPSSAPMLRPPQAHADPRADDTLAPLRDFVRGHYRLAATFGDHDVYLLVSSG